MKNLDDILKEYLSKRDDGGAHFNINSYDDLQHFESFLMETGYIHQFDKQKLNELFGNSKISKTITKSLSYIKSKLMPLWNKLVYLVRTSYSSIKSNFISKCGRIENEIKNYDLQEDFEIALPKVTPPKMEEFNNISGEISSISDQKQDVSEGAKEALKGYYNEFLTCEYLLAMNSGAEPLTEGKIVSLLYPPDKSKAVYVKNLSAQNIIYIKTKCLEKLTLLADLLGGVDSSKFKEVNQSIQIASRDMANYLTKSIEKSGAYIYDIFAKGEEEKFISVSDIVLKGRRNEEFFEDAYSLKVYETKKIDVASRTFSTIAEELCDEIGRAHV